jgi:hypothetical protein
MATQPTCSTSKLTLAAQPTLPSRATNFECKTAAANWAGSNLRCKAGQLKLAPTTQHVPCMGRLASTITWLGSWVCSAQTPATTASRCVVHSVVALSPPSPHAHKVPHQTMATSHSLLCMARLCPRADRRQQGPACPTCCTYHKCMLRTRTALRIRPKTRRMSTWHQH